MRRRPSAQAIVLALAFMACSICVVSTHFTKDGARQPLKTQIQNNNEGERRHTGQQSEFYFKNLNITWRLLDEHLFLSPANISLQKM